MWRYDKEEEDVGMDDGGEEKDEDEKEELGSSGAPGDERGAGNNLQMEQMQDADEDVKEELVEEEEEVRKEAKRAKLQ